MSQIAPFKRPGTVAQDVYDYLRAQLLAGTLGAGAWLREQEVARTLDVSRTPVREAVRRLAQDGLLVIEANRGVRVHTPDLAEVRAAYEVRSALEGMAAALAALRAGPDAAARLDVHLKAMSEAPSEDAVTHIEADNGFHTLVAELSANPVLVDHVERLTVRITRIKVITRHLNPTGFARAQHAAIASAILDGDPVAARRCMEEHVRANLAFIETSLRHQPDGARHDAGDAGPDEERSTT